MQKASMTMKQIVSYFAMAVLVLGGATASVSPAQSPKPAAEKPVTARATFAGGCFWCMEEAFDKVPGVTATISGYIGGQTKNPTYEQVSGGRTGHAEVVQLEYDPKRVSYDKLLEVFWRNI